MLKFLVIVFLIGFLLTKVFGLFFRVLAGGSTSRPNQRGYQQQYQSGRSKDGSVNIDYVPHGSKAPKNFKGGEYVDYEEID